MWIKINGKDSSSVAGLVITSVPPISAPPRRINQVTIDGRPGDIIEDLGAEAYDKAFTILLHNGFDPDEVIEYFRTSGDIVFSNEPDKVYKYSQLTGIDIARGNFNSIKVATITVHVQPYKLQYQERPETLTASPAGVYNYGNTNAAPRIRINGSGQVTLNLDDHTAFVIDMPAAGWIVIDAAEMNAYSSENLANRSVTGSYDNILLSPGIHSLSWSGTVTSIVVTNMSRWI